MFLYKNFSIFIIILSFICFIFIPLLIFWIFKKTNEKKVVKVNIGEKIIKIYLFNIIIFLIILIYAKNNFKIKQKKPIIIPSTQIETKEEWFQIEQIFNIDKNKWEYPMDEKPINYYPIEKHNLPTKTEDGSQKIWDLNRKTWAKGQHKIKRTYKFFGFNGLDQCQHPDLVAQSLTPLMKGPFDNWLLDSNDPFITREEFELFKDLFKNVYYFSTIRESIKSDFDSNILVSIDYLLHQIRFDYEGPKYLLEEDKDFYIGILKFFIQKKIRGERKEISYFLHFNPVKQYITLYTKPMNAKENPTYDNLFLYLQRK